MIRYVIILTTCLVLSSLFVKQDVGKKMHGI